MPQLKILWQKELGNRFEVTVIYRRGEVTCPRCGKVAHKEPDRRRQQKQDRRLRDKDKFSVSGGGCLRRALDIGIVEGKNNRIKAIKRMAYGYRNMDNFRMRILATNPGYKSDFHTY